jgi:hypothetical protein
MFDVTRHLYCLKSGDKQVNEEQKKWNDQHWANFGPNEFFRFGCVMLIWMVAGLILSITLKNTIWIAIFLISMFVLPILAQWWKPLYFVYRKILGNKNLPTEPRKLTWLKLSTERFEWWHFLIFGWAISMNLLLFYLAYKYLSK